MKNDDFERFLEAQVFIKEGTDKFVRVLNEGLNENKFTAEESLGVCVAAIARGLALVKATCANPEARAKDMDDIFAGLIQCVAAGHAAVLSLHAAGFDPPPITVAAFDMSKKN